MWSSSCTRTGATVAPPNLARMTVLHYHEFGDPAGEPLLAVHGITAHGKRFRRLAEEAWPQRRTIAVDLRGHGRSTYDGPWSIPQHATDLVDTLDACGIESADVVAHSYGGAITAARLLRAPERLRRWVLLDPAIALDPPDATEAADEALVADGFAFAFRTVEEAVAATPRRPRERT